MIGSVFAGRYVLNGFLSDGPIFAQYSAKDKLVGRDLSLRMLKPPFDKEELFKKALVSAVLKVSQVQSPSVEKLIEMEEEDDHAYILGELTRAPSLADRIRKLAPFTSSVAVTSAIGVVRGLDAFHKAGLAHGDVSGDNVAMLADGDTRLQLGGIWEAYPSSQSAGSIVLPSLAPYLAPEVSTGGLPSASSDLYSVGVLLFELLTGRKPYHADTAIATAMKHATDPIPRVRSLNSSVPVVLDEIVYKSMAKDPNSRYVNASELLFDLRQVQDAVRFGRTLSWPIRGQATATPAAAPAPQAVAPRMSAIRDRQDREDSPRKHKEDRDVPVWMVIVFTAVLSMFVVLIGCLVFFNVTRPRLITVPGVSGDTVQEARIVLQKAHLQMREGPSVSNEHVKQDQIISTEPAAGRKVNENSVIVVTTSSGSDQVKVPNLIGVTQDKAKGYLTNAHLFLDPQVNHESSKLEVDKVTKQNPDPDKLVPRESKVTITVSDGPTQSTDDSTPSKPQNDFTINLPLDDLTQVTRVRVDVIDEDGTRTIYEETHSPGDPAVDVPAKAKGKQAKFEVYYDDHRVKSFKQNANETQE